MPDIATAHLECPCPHGDRGSRGAFTEGEVDFRKCLTCGVLFRHPLPSPEYLSELYESGYQAEKIDTGSTNQESGGYAIERYARFLKKRFPMAGLRVLDFGAGSGALVQALRKRNIDAYGVEYAISACEYAATTRGIQLYSRLADVPKRSFDVITMIEVIEHLTDWWETLAQLRSVLRPNGVLIVTTPNKNGWRARMERGYWREAQKKFHVVLFDKSSLRYHLGRAGFNDIQQLTFPPIPKSGVIQCVAARCFQGAGLGGSLCFLASR